MRLSFGRTYYCTVALALLIGPFSAAMCSGAARSSQVVIPSGLLSHPMLKDFEPELVSVTDIDLAVLQSAAAEVRVLDRVPAREMVFAHSAEGWGLVLADKLLSRNWRSVVEARLRRLSNSACSLDVAGLAQDLTRLVVDPDPRYGIVISSVDDIPTNYRSSDVFRDLERQGREPASVRAELLRRVPRTIAPPRMACAGDSARIEYYTWHYFGGEVTRWIIRLSPSQASIKRKSLAGGIGSYDYYQ